MAALTVLMVPSRSVFKRERATDVFFRPCFHKEGRDYADTAFKDHQGNVQLRFSMCDWRQRPDRDWIARNGRDRRPFWLCRKSGSYRDRRMGLPVCACAARSCTVL